MISISNKPGHLIRRCHQISVSLFFQESEGSDLTPIQFSILSILSEAEELDQKTLAAVASLDKSTAAETIRRLETKKLVKRRPAETDRRSRIVSLTDLGWEVVAVMRPKIDRVHKRLIDALDEHEKPLFVHLLKKICSELESESRVKSSPVDLSRPD